jgi:hypothetical protein
MDGAAARRREQVRPGPSTTGRAVAVLAAAALAVVLWGGYGRGWRWTGFEHRAMLWDWLHVLVLPLAVTVTPLWLRHRDRLGRKRHLLLGTFVAAFGIVVVLGYALDLHWTGFPGNTLWDWLELLVLPLAVGLLPVWLEVSNSVRTVHVVAGAVALALVAVAVVGGYGYSWKWTGFAGNTLFDWLQLFVAPLVLPIVLIPAVGAWMAVAESDGVSG